MRLPGTVEFSYDELIGNRKFHTRITRDKHKDCKVRQELYRANQYEKPRQDAGVFYYQNLIRIIRIMLILEELLKLGDELLSHASH